jgi:UDP-sugar pyrophosphorylase
MSTLPDSLKPKIAASLLDEEQIGLLEVLMAHGQQHIVDGWDEAGTNDEGKLAFLRQLKQVDRDYPGGIGAYLAKARQLLQDPSAGAAPGSGAHLEAPEVTDLTRHDDVYREMERRGLAQTGSIAFVLVAGGLGERLGYDGIKIELPIELTAHTTYLQRYCEMVKAMEERANRARVGKRVTIPFFIMTSGGTCARTVGVLEDHDYFGLDPAQVPVREQHLVPSISDREARLVLDDAYSLQLKPNGHGDIHALLHQDGFAEAARSMGKTHLVFIQDTNAQIADLILPALGASLEKDHDFNFVCVPRVPAEPLGAVVRIRESEQVRTIAVEYNVLDRFLHELEGTGDEADASGYSPYPGSINLLVVKLDSYLGVLRETGGAVAEFINPKYTDYSRTSFASPTRIETLMQDLACSYGPGARIGVSLFERGWALAALKNKLESAMALAAAGAPSYSATVAESGFYASGRIKLAAAGAEIEASEETNFHGIPFTRGARVVLSPSYALCLADAAPKLRKVYLSKDASLVIDGEDVILEDVRLEGGSGLVIRACPGASVTVRDLRLTKPGAPFKELGVDELHDPEVSPILKMRGYRNESPAPVVFDIDEPGSYLIGPDASCQRLTPPQTPPRSS